jgi:hypothetical protein
MAQRHRLAHEYGEIDDRLIWNVATVHIAALITQIEPLVQPKAQADGPWGSPRGSPPLAESRLSSNTEEF